MAETTSEKQRRFTKAIVRLIQFGHDIGYEFTLGDCYRSKHCTHGHPKSCHRSRLAVDLNLFIEDEYITDGGHEAWYILHKKWRELGGSEMIDGDANHFSFEHEGVR